MSRPQERRTEGGTGRVEAIPASGRSGSMGGGMDLLLSLLEGVKRSGKGWTARCPAHADRNASLSVSATQDGKVLLHDFAGCSVLAIVQSLGLSLADLFPNRLTPATPEESRAARRASLHADWSAAGGVLTREAAVVQCAVAYVKRGEVLSELDQNRLDLAVERILAAREVLHGRR